MKFNKWRLPLLDQISFAVQSFTESPSLWLALPLLASIFIGSLHCVGMCGPLVIGVTNGQANKTIAYQVGRLISYTSLALLAQSVGSMVLNSHLQWISPIGGLLIGIFFIYSGLKIIKPKFKIKTGVPFMTSVKNYFFKKAYSAENQKVTAFSVGLLTALIPCGWLYAYVSTLMVIDSPLIALSLIGIFWAGTLPALSFTAFAAKRPLFKLNQFSRNLTGILIIVLGIYTISSKWTKFHSPNRLSSEVHDVEMCH